MAYLFWNTLPFLSPILLVMYHLQSQWKQFGKTTSKATLIAKSWLVIIVVGAFPTQSLKALNIHTKWCSLLIKIQRGNYHVNMVVRITKHSKYWMVLVCLISSIEGDCLIKTLKVLNADWVRPKSIDKSTFILYFHLSESYLNNLIHISTRRQ